MITFMVGPPGSGKTLISLQRYVLRALKEGRKVYHNIRGLDFVKIANFLDIDPYIIEQSLDYMYSPFIEEWAKDNNLHNEFLRLGEIKFEQKYIKQLEVFYKTKVEEILKTIPFLVKDYLIVLDEAQNFIGANDHKERKNVDFFEYATTHRHHGHELLIVTQHEDNVDIKIRRISNLLIFLFRRDILGALFKDSVKERHYAGCSSGTPELLTKFITKYDKRLFNLYRSYVSTDIKEHRKFRSIWRNGFLLVLLVIAVVGLSRGCAFKDKWIKNKTPAKKVENVSSSSSAVVLKNPSDWLGEYTDYFCGDKMFYILRLNSVVDSFPPAVVPAGVCPFANYQFKSEVKK